MVDFTAYTLVVDLGLISMLILLGALLRAKVPFLQSLLLPSAIIAGLLGFLLGPHVLGAAGWSIGDWQITGLPFSEAIGTYTSILIAVVFACMSISDDFGFKAMGKDLASFSGYGVLMSAGQVLVGVVLVIAILGPLLGAPDELGLVLFASWSGGFGTSAALGDVFASNGHPEISSVAFTSATVGMFVGVVGGIILARHGAQRGHAQAFDGTKHLPDYVRTGILPADKRTPLGINTFSGGSLESLTFHVGLVSVLLLLAYWLKTFLDDTITQVSFPLFTLTFLIGLIARAVLRTFRISQQIDKDTVKSMSGSAADILIVCGIVSIQPSFVAEHVTSLVWIWVVGLAFCVALGLFVAPKVLGKGWFEKQLFTWGWATGSVATGIALLRIVDPERESTAVEDFGYAYIPLIPVETTAVAVAPYMVIAGASWAVAGIWGLIAVAGWLVAAWGAGQFKRAPHATP